MKPPPPKKSKKAKKPQSKKNASKTKRGNWIRVADVGAAYFKLTNGKVPCTQTVRNWMKHGKVSYNGERVFLGYVEKNGCLLTTTEWLQAFVEELYDETL